MKRSRSTAFVGPVTKREEVAASAARSRSVLLGDLAGIGGATLVALFDQRGVCTALRRSPLICAFGAYRVLAEVSVVARGKSALAIDVDGRSVFVRRLFDGSYAMVSTAAGADAYITEVLLIEAAAAYALREATFDRDVDDAVAIVETETALHESNTLRIDRSLLLPAAGERPSELPPIEASLVLSLGSLAGVYRDLEEDAGQAAANRALTLDDDDASSPIAC